MFWQGIHAISRLNKQGRSSWQVLIRVGSAGVNPVDTYIRMGLFAQLPSLPYIPGRDGAGTIEKVGARVESLKVSVAYQ